MTHSEVQLNCDAHWVVEAFADKLGVAASGARTGDIGTHVGTALVAEAAHIGVAFTNPGDLGAANPRRWRHLAAHLNRRRGGHISHAPLFDGFPDQLPIRDDITARRWLATTIDRHNATPAAGTLDLSARGWWPESSIAPDVDQIAAALTREQDLLGDRHIEWVLLDVASDADATAALHRWLTTVCVARSALSSTDRTLVEQLLDTWGDNTVDLDQVTFSETRALLLARRWNAYVTHGDDDARRVFRNGTVTPDDVLRTLAVIGDSDISLERPLRVGHLNRRARRLIADVLETSGRRRDVWRRRNLWLHILAACHAGEWKDRHPTAAALAAELRRERYDTTATRSRAEQAVADGRIDDAISILASEAPGVLVRETRRLAKLAESDCSSTLSAALASVDVGARTLLDAREQLVDNGATYPRIAVTKRGTTVPIDRQAGHLRISDDRAGELVAAIDTNVQRTFADTRWDDERIWIDPRARKLLHVHQQRETSDTLAVVERGSRLDGVTTPTLRMFCYWHETTQRSDLDLSVVALDDQYDLVSWVSWTNLADTVMTHSGDITAAPCGAVEFVDIDLDHARGKAAHDGWRYLAPVISRYAGPAFDQLAAAMVGWMGRRDCTTDRRTFDVKTVVDAYPLHGSGGIARPFLYDLVDNDVIYVDTYQTSRYGAAVENDEAAASVLAGVVARGTYKTSWDTYLRVVAEARGATIVDDRHDATVTVGIGAGHDHNLLRPWTLTEWCQ